jgi:protease-4
MVQQPGSRFLRVFSWLGWIGVLMCIPIILGLYGTFHEYFDRSGGIQEKYHSLSKSARDKVAVIQVNGVIMDGDGFVKRQIDRARRDDKVKAIVVRIDSPGGTVSGSDYLYHHLCKLRDEKKVPLVVSMGSMAASGGYYLAMAVGDQKDSIYAENTTTTGSIGVIIPHYDLSGLLERYNVKNDSIVSHPRKQLLSMTKETSPEDREILQRYVNESFKRFKQVVRSGRPAFRDDEKTLDQLATGEIFSAVQAEKSGLVDRIGFLEDAIQRAIELAGLSPNQVRVVTYKQPLTLMSALTSTRAGADNWDSLALELTVPRAYYLMTSLPALTRLPVVVNH